MLSDVAIKVENLSKCYHIYNKPNDRLKQMLVGGLKQYYNEYWAVQGVSFEIKKGETVGIVGRNGSGKSTLLQLICGVLNPTHGSVQVNGRVAALLELGSGFNPDFTGRENVYLNGAVLGLSKKEIDDRFDEIAAFADIGTFIEQPIKTYSSGMMMRLAFAVAINVEPQVLIIDEALSVGDELFQRKCFSRIEAIRAKGCTILFVSHSGAQVVELCDHAILMDSGNMLAAGGPKNIVACYQKLLYVPAEKRESIREQICKKTELALDSTVAKEVNPKNGSTSLDSKNGFKDYLDLNLKPNSTIEYESNGAYIDTPFVFTLSGQKVNNLTCGETYKYKYSVRFTKSATNVRFGMLIKTTNGVELGGALSASSYQDSLSYVEAGVSYCIEFKFTCSLNPGMYFMNAGVVGEVDGKETYLHRIIDVAAFRVMQVDSNLATAIVDFNCHPTLKMMRTQA